MTPWQQRFDDLNVKNVIDTHIAPKIKSVKSKENIEIERIKRVEAVIEKLNNMLPFIDSKDTSFKVFQEISRAIEKINNSFDDFLIVGKLLNYDEIDDATDRLLENLPLLKATESISVFSSKRKKDIEKLYKEIDIYLLKTKTDAEKSLTHIESLEVEGEQLSQFLARKVLINDYEKRANEEKKEAEKWTKYTSWSAFATLLVLAITFFVALFANKDNEFLNFQLLGTKILFTATLGLIAKWSSKRANRHLSEEAKYHRLAVNMATINSFIAQIGETERNAVISAVAIKIFTETNGNETATDFETANILDLIKGILPKIEK